MSRWRTGTGGGWWRLLTRWPSWAGYAAAGWSLAYGLLGVWWTVGGDGFPFGPVDEDHRTGSILEGSSAGVVAPIMAVVGLAGAVAALLMARGLLAGRWAFGLVAAGWSIAVALTLVIPDYTMLALLAFSPLLLVFAFTGVPGEQEGLGDILYWHRTNLVLLFVCGLLWAATTLAYQRRVRAACPHCGRGRGAADPGPSRETLLRWGHRAVLVAWLAPLPYEVTRVAWYLGFPLGITEDFLRMMQDTPGMLEVGLGCAVASTVGGALTNGLVSRWGEVYPRWIWFKAGRPVPPALAVVPASVVAIVLIPAGLMVVWTPELRGGGWAMSVPALLWIVWGVALGAATIAYHRRRRGTCTHCSSGDDVPGRVVTMSG
ncbi:hypothetical protein [Cryptosporangium arvum]|uniref:Uncharacterized protein n=1 Tax=Cryptosporangium arvum DSM 44712 TaxID=927661 RepID=A0A010ZV70_9ACTN|nr:hypothetical protein [Cryptosporangium arvum]EXG81107.1 hypothetical protein CryarDRAFT_2203 [Cryptosporangium arvum DSM 44712]